MNLDKRTKIIFNLLAIIAIIMLCFAITPKTLQNDTFYTIKIGELVSEQGIDMKDPFSWHEDLPYTYPHWLYDVGIYQIFNLGEMTGIPDGGMLFIYLSTIILTCVLGIIIYLTNCKLTKNKLISFIITMIGMYLLKDFIAARAQLISFILFALTVLWIENFLETKKKRYLLGLVLISLILVNIHVAVWPFFFVIFLPYIAEFIIAWLADKHILSKLNIRYLNYQKNSLQKQIEKMQIVSKPIKNKEIKQENLEKRYKQAEEKLEKAEERKQKIEIKTPELRENPYKIKIRKNSSVKWLVLVMIICVLTGFLTPIGDTPFTYLAKTMEGNTTKSISEHQPLTLFNDKATMVSLAILLAILIFTDTKIKLSDLFMIAGLIFMLFMSRRQISLFIVVGGFIFAKLITELIEKYDKETLEKITKAMTTISGRIIVLLLAAIMVIWIYGPKRNNVYISESSYPVEAADYILENLDIENMRLYNEYNYGSYLLYRGIPVFIDSRADLYAPEFNGTKKEDGKYEGKDVFSDYIAISTIGTYYETKFKDYNITHVICVKNAKLNLFLSRNTDYKELYSDDNFVIYERNAQ